LSSRVTHHKNGKAVDHSGRTALSGWSAWVASAGRPTHRTAHQVCVDRQPQHRQGAWSSRSRPRCCCGRIRWSS